MKKFILLILTLMITLMSTACNNSNEIFKGQSTELLFGFNNYTEVQATAAMWGNVFGRAEVNSNNKFVTEGNGSLHVQPQGDYTTENCYPFVRLRATSKYFTKSDFSNYSHISLDAYNAGNEDYAVYMHVTAYDEYGTLVDINAKRFVLISGVWTKMILDFSNGSIKKAFDNLTNVMEVTLQFEDYKESKNDTVGSLYFDNLVGVKQNNAVTFTQNRVDNEIMNFESLDDLNLIDTHYYTQTQSIYFICNSQLTLNTDKAFVKDGNSSMRAQFNLYYSPYEEFTFFKSQFTINLKSTDASVFNSNYDGISIDIMSANSQPVIYTVKVDSSKSVNITLQPYVWTTVTITGLDMANVEKLQVITDTDKCFYTETAKVLYVDNVVGVLKETNV